MHSYYSTRRALCVALALLPASIVLGVAPGQTDTFEDGTTQGWTVALFGAAHPSPPVNIATGGPAGTDDNFLRLPSVSGGGPGSRLVGINRDQWSGDYLAAGITSITLDVRNFGTSDLSLRLLFLDPLVGPPNHVAFSVDSVLVPAGGDWMSVAFPVSVAALDALLGTTEGALRNTTELRLFHGTQPGFPGEEVAALLGVDNIRAVGSGPVVPEARPEALWLGMSLTGLWAWRRRRDARRD